jgi:molecular chaperone DnaK
MVDEAAKNQEADDERKKEIELRNQLDTLVYQTEKLLKENSEKINDDDVSRLRTLIEKSKDSLKTGTGILNCHAELNEVLQQVVSSMYENAQPHESQEASEQDDVIDAEFDETGS